MKGDADLLVIECSAHRAFPGHLTPAGVASIVRDSGARRVVLVHVYPIRQSAPGVRIVSEEPALRTRRLT